MIILLITRPKGGQMKTIKIMSVLMLSAVLTACGGGVGTEPSAYTAKIYPIEGDYDRYETVGPFSSRDECTAKAIEMNAAGYSCEPKTN
tara:strand:- start:30 stop:296 length:267 start_codon:yes stop_codon:yes gene_type:complete